MTWKTQIPAELESKIEDIAEPAGYQSKSELVRDAVREKIGELNNETGEINIIDDKKEEATENIKEIALDRKRGESERKNAVSCLGSFGEIAMEPLSEVAKDAEDSRSNQLDDDVLAADGYDIRKRARRQMDDIINE